MDVPQNLSILYTSSYYYGVHCRNTSREDFLFHLRDQCRVDSHFRFAIQRNFDKKKLQLGMHIHNYVTSSQVMESTMHVQIHRGVLIDVLGFLYASSAFV